MFDFDEIEDHFARSSDDNAARTLPKLLESEWLGVTKHNPHARIRLFCLAGVGVPAGSFSQWASEEIHLRYPALEVAVLELPGHGDNKGEPFSDYVACAWAICSELLRIHFYSGPAGGAASSHTRPLALWGNSLGSRIATEVAAVLVGPLGERCKRLFVSARGAPHIVGSARLPDPLPDIKGSTVGDVERIALGLLAGSVTAAQLKKYERWFDLLARTDAKTLYTFTQALVGDMVMGVGPCVRSSSTSGGVVDCPLHYFHGGADEHWPLAAAGRWDSLPGTWERYTSAAFSWGECPGASHGDMGAVESPAFPAICESLTRLVATESLA